jgi:hypothetical protein
MRTQCVLLRGEIQTARDYIIAVGSVDETGCFPPLQILA